MLEDKRIDDLFEAARKEPSHRSLKSVEQFIQSTPSTSTSLIVKWLKQYKMNILISTGGILAAAIILFPNKGADETTIMQEVADNSGPEFVVIDKPEADSIEIKAISEPSISKSSEVKAKEVNENNRDLSETEERIIVKPAKREEMVSKGEVDEKVEVQEPPKREGIKQIDQEKKSKEYSIILESNKGKSSSETFRKYLLDNLTQLNHEFSSSASKSEVRKFTLRLDNGLKADFKMQVSGFDTCELYWAVDANGEIINIWYRMDQKEKKELDFSKSSSFSIRVKHKHEEF